MDVTLLSVLGLGLVLGLRHALEPDHLAAVSTIVASGPNLKRSSLIGTFWGIGHSVALLCVGVVVLAFKLQIPERLTAWLELAVAVMLVLLGLQSLLKTITGWRVHLHRHAHDGHTHVHVHAHAPGANHVHRHRHLLAAGVKPFVVGLVHGMAGSGALLLVVLATIPSALLGFVYIGVFGIGSIGGMLLMSSAISLPFVLRGNRVARIDHVLQTVTGLCSLGFGAFLVWQYGVQQRLLF